jgi:hypothetical protein
MTTTTLRGIAALTFMVVAHKRTSSGFGPAPRRLCRILALFSRVLADANGNGFHSGFESVLPDIAA